MMQIQGLSELCAALPFSEARKVRALAAAIAAFDAASDKADAASKISRELAPIGIQSLSMPTFYRKLAMLRADNFNARALVDGRAARRMRTDCGIASNAELIAHWHSLCAANRRKSSPAFRALVAELASGKYIPGCGTWRDIWSSENGGMAAPESMECPYSLRDLPRGWSRLMKLKPDSYALSAVRTGTMAAALSFSPTVTRTRAGLAPCQIVQVDDMWHEVKVEWGSNERAQRVVELAMVDVLTGHVVCRMLKPIRERDDGTKEMLKQEWMRYVVHYLLCICGIPAQGCLIMGEHGTATMDAEMMNDIATVAGSAVRFGAGGLLSQPLAKGLPGGCAKGNPRYKGVIEELHALIKNELGNVRGHIGGGRGFQPEDAAAIDREFESLRDLRDSFESTHPGASARFRMPYLPYWDFADLVSDAYERIDNRTDHHMEGWDKCGFIVGEWRPAANQGWLPLSALDGMKPEAAQAFRNLIESDSSLYRTRRMSPREAFCSRAKELHKMSPDAAVVLLGQKLARPAKCNDRLELRYRDSDTLADLKIAGILDGGILLERGKNYLVWVNPMDAKTAYIATESGAYIGTSRVLAAARYDDQAAIARQLGVRSSAIAAEKRRMAPIIQARIRAAAEDARANAETLFGSDPAKDQAARQAALAGAQRTSLTDLLPEVPEKESTDLNDIL